jgi:hypothetical protein
MGSRYALVTTDRMYACSAGAEKITCRSARDVALKRVKFACVEMTGFHASFGIGTSLASFRRFWAVAASWNSSQPGLVQL